MDELATFLKALNTGRVVTASTLAQLLMARPESGAEDKLYRYWFIVQPDAPYRVGHGGGAPGINAEIALYPKSDRQIIALPNRDPPTASRIVTILEKVVFAADPVGTCAKALAKATQLPVRMSRPALNSDVCSTLVARRQRPWGLHPKY